MTGKRMERVPYCQPKHEASNQQKRTMVEETIAKAWAEATQSKHRSGLKAYHSFCDTQNIPQQDHLPAKEELLCTFASSFAGQMTGDAICSKLNGIRAFHIQNNLPYNNGIRLKYTLIGLDKQAPADSKQIERPLITKEMLDMLHEELDLEVPKDIAIFALATTAFYAQVRLGELVPDRQDKTLFDAKAHPTGKNLAKPHTIHGSRTLHLPRTKMEQVKGEDVLLSKQNGHTDPIDALNNHIFQNDIQNDTPLASFKEGRSKRKCITKNAMLKQCNNIWTKRGLGQFTGHCFRIGGTTFYLIKGINPDIVKTLGRWKSDTFRRYWRNLKALGILHTEHMENGEIKQKKWNLHPDA